MVVDLRQLEYFVAVAEEASFTRAAVRVHISQSGVSAQVRRLEDELGAPLIDRSGRRATLTAAGAAALAPARAALAAAERVRRGVDDVNGLLRGTLAVGMVSGCTVTPLFAAVARIRAAHPGVAVSLHEDASDRLVAAVGSGALDVALVGTAGPPPAGLGRLEIVSEGLVALVPDGHPLAGRDRARLAEVCSHAVVCLPVGTGIRAVFDDACAASGLLPDVALQASAPDALLDLAARGVGAAILSASMAGDDGRLHAVALDDVPTPAVLSLVHGAAANPAADAFVAYAREAFGVPVGA